MPEIPPPKSFIKKKFTKFPKLALTEHFNYLVNGAKATVAKLIQLREEVSGYLESMESEEEVGGVGAIGFISGVVPLPEAEEKPGEKSVQTHGQSPHAGDDNGGLGDRTAQLCCVDFDNLSF